LQLRVIYLTAAQTGAIGFGIFGTTSGTSSSDPGTSHGDTFTASVTVNARSPFVDTGDLGTSGYVPPQGDDLQTSPAGFGPSNPMWTHITVPAAALGNLPFGATAFLQEANSFSGVTCPVQACFGQTSSITLAGGATLVAPFMVEVRVDNAKHYTNLRKWTLIHVFDDGTSYEIVDQACVMSHGTATNAPCVQSKSTARDDKKDYVAVLWLTRNGYIRNG
ncbi:MAG TPA: hypothetical protein VFX74_00145, partial [Candidatus Limnocylindria bacterium]|nr:hypothetical protein [Candidatus Limnocylindria bacterium]